MCFHWMRLKPYDHQCVRCFQPGQPIYCCVCHPHCICVQCNGKTSDSNTLNCLRASCTNTRNSRLLEIERASDNSNDQCSVVSCTSFIQQRTIRFSICRDYFKFFCFETKERKIISVSFVSIF